MKRILAFTLILFGTTSCVYVAPTNEEVFETIKNEKEYSQIYSYSYATSFNNSLAPEEERNNPYGLIYTFYGRIKDEDVFYVYGIQEWGVMFEPAIYDRPLDFSYDECLNLFSLNMNNKKFEKDLSDNITFVTNTDVIESLFGNDNPSIDNDFVLKCDGHNYVYQSNGELCYSYID